MGRTFWTIGGLVGFAVLALFGFLLYVLLASGDPGYWSGEIAAFERRDVSNPPPRGAVLFVGDDDVRLWDNLAYDMAPIVTIARGFGGAQISHVTYYIPRIVAPYRPQAIVLMAGEADMSDVRGRRPEDVLDDYKKFVAALRKADIAAPVYFVSIHPQPMRQSRWLGAKRANALIADYSKTVPGLHYIDVAEALVDAAGEARRDLFRWDGLSLNEAGRAILTQKIKPVLLQAGYGGNGK
jgi:lysophospholipase L1-like esterase